MFPEQGHTPNITFHSAVFPLICLDFRDICPILKEPKALTAVIDLFEDHVRQKHPNTELIAGETFISVRKSSVCIYHSTVQLSKPLTGHKMLIY